jgi:hypothetical protein
LLHSQDVPALAVKVTDPPVQKVVAPDGVIVAVGNGFTVTDCAADVLEHPFELVTVTVKLPELTTLIACVVAPLLHNHELPALAVSVTDPPAQKVVAPDGVIVAVGNGFTVTVCTDEVFSHPLEFVTVTVKLPEFTTLIACVVAPLLHNHDVPALAVKVTDPPAQKVVAPDGVIVAVGNVFTVTVCVEEVFSHPLEFVTVTVKLPEFTTLIACVVAPLLHNQEVPALAVKVTDPPAQKVVAPDGVIVAVGNGFTVTVCVEDVFSHPLEFVTVTVKLPEFTTLIVCVVAPLLHNHDVPALAVKVTDPPAQKVVAPDGVIVAVGNGFTVTVCVEDVFSHPLELVTVTVKFPELVTLIA